MSGLFYEISTEAKESWQAIADYFPLLRGEFEKVTDINKVGNKNTFNNFCILSDSVPDSIKAIIAKNIEIKITATLVSIITNTVLTDPEKVGQWFEKKLGNNEVNSKVQDFMDTVSNNAIYEDVAAALGMSSLTLNEKAPHPVSLVSTSGNTTLNYAAEDKSKWTEQEIQYHIEYLTRQGTPQNQPRSVLTTGPNVAPTGNPNAEIINLLQDELANRIQARHTANSSAEKRAVAAEKRNIETYNRERAGVKFNVKAASAITISGGGAIGGVNKSDYLDFGRQINATVPLVNKNTGNSVNYTFTFNVRTMLVDTAQEKLLPAIASIKERENFYNYLKWRAGTASFFKDFVLNLKEIDKDVARDTSSNLRDRLIKEMTKSSGLLAPKLWGNLAETRYFTLIVDKSDLEVLQRTYNLDLESKSSLQRVFNNLRLLSLIVVNQDRSELTFYDSDNPSRFNVINYKKVVSDDDLLKRFIMSRQ